MTIDSRYNNKFILILMILSVASFLTSLFALQLFIGLLFVVWLFEKNSEKKKAVDMFILLILIYGSVRIITVLFSNYSISNEVYYKELYFYLSAIVFGYYFKALNGNNTDKFLNALIYSGVVVAIIGIVRFNLGQVHRAQSITSGYSTFSMFILTIYLFTLIWNKNFFKKESIYIHAFKLGILLAALVTSLGRTNIAVALLGSFIALVWKKVKITEAIIVIFLAVIISSVSFHNNSREYENRTENISALSDRDILYEGFFMIWDQHPILGHGPRTFKEVFPVYEKFADQGIGGWHNEYMQTYIESGILGLLALLCLFAYLLFKVGRSALERENPYQNISLGLIFVFCGILIAVLTDGIMTSPIMAPVLSMYIGLAASVEFKKNRLNLTE